MYYSINIIKRCQLCIDTDGKHFQHLLQYFIALKKFKCQIKFSLFVSKPKTNGHTV
jgi:hypothetical protein